MNSSAFLTNAAVMIAEGENASQVKRHIRLTEPIPKILQMVDDGKIPLTAPGRRTGHRQNFREQQDSSIDSRPFSWYNT